MRTLIAVSLVILSAAPATLWADHIRDLQNAAINLGRSPLAHWGTDPENYTQWGSHTNRLIPVYTYGTKGAGAGIDLDDYVGSNSTYRSEAGLRRIYGRVPRNTLSADATYMDQTNIHDIQKAGFIAGRKHIILIIFDGMDWQTTRAASIHNLKRVAYEQGRGTGTHFQDYDADGTSQFGFMVTSPHNNGTKTNPNEQTVLNPGGIMPGGYDPTRGGAFPWDKAADRQYLTSQPDGESGSHAYTDSASSATSMTAGRKTYNNAIAVGPDGSRLTTIARRCQEAGYRVGIVSSVPISHATPATAYAHNVARRDYQDITRDMLGLPSISHPDGPLPGLDVVIGGGYGDERDKDAGQGKNFIPGNVYLTKRDRQSAASRYVVSMRKSGTNGAKQLARRAKAAAKQKKRLLGFYGVGAAKGHLPFATADGDYETVQGRNKKAEEYSAADIKENPTLAQMTDAALQVLSANESPFWLMVEAGDVDWANHDNNLDNSIGAVNSGDAAVKVVTDWVEANSNWNESLVIVTADHGHYLTLTQPEALAANVVTTAGDRQAADKPRRDATNAPPAHLAP